MCIQRSLFQMFLLNLQSSLTSLGKFLKTLFIFLKKYFKNYKNFNKLFKFFFNVSLIKYSYSLHVYTRFYVPTLGKKLAVGCQVPWKPTVYSSVSYPVSVLHFVRFLKSTSVNKHICLLRFLMRTTPASRPNKRNKDSKA